MGNALVACAYFISTGYQGVNTKLFLAGGLEVELKVIDRGVALASA